MASCLKSSLALIIKETIDNDLNIVNLLSSLICFSVSLHGLKNFLTSIFSFPSLFWGFSSIILSLIFFIPSLGWASSYFTFSIILLISTAWFLEISLFFSSLSIPIILFSLSNSFSFIGSAFFSKKSLSNVLFSCNSSASIHSIVNFTGILSLVAKKKEYFSRICTMTFFAFCSKGNIIPE